MKHIRTGAAVAAVALTLSLAGCGGGGDDNGGFVVEDRTTDVPASAQQDSAGLVAFLRDLIASRTDETSEPILLGDAVLPTSETLEPLPVR